MTLEQRAARVRLLLMDVDGVLTDGKLLFIPDGKGGVHETKQFDSQDGIALRWLSWYQIPTGVISGRDSAAVVERAAQVGMKYVYQGHIEKVPILNEILADARIAPEDVAYIGDDLTDLILFRRVGLGIAVKNARDEVKRAAHYVTSSPGGQGAVRDAIELILKAKGIWPEILKKYEANLR
jgi:3-deoxy-D-manno-octulosonate 8-phosphate phosphatase (KDO 8-P phosphatase)